MTMYVGGSWGGTVTPKVREERKTLHLKLEKSSLKNFVMDDYPKAKRTHKTLIPLKTYITEEWIRITKE